MKLTKAVLLSAVGATPAPEGSAPTPTCLESDRVFSVSCNSNFIIEIDGKIIVIVFVFNVS